MRIWNLDKINMLEFAKKYGYSVHSQNGECGVIQECLNRIPILNKHKKAIEFGAPTKKWMSNIYHLHELGWHCKWIDNNPKEGDILKATITKDNINDIVRVGDCSVLSIDVDGQDYEIWKEYIGVSEIVIIEINSSLDPLKDFYSPDKGSNFSAMMKLADVKGYFLVSHTGNLVFCLNKYIDLFPECDIDWRENIDLVFNKSWLK